jgi:hypothetical protein
LTMVEKAASALNNHAPIGLTSCLSARVVFLRAV